MTHTHTHPDGTSSQCADVSSSGAGKPAGVGNETEGAKSEAEDEVVIEELVREWSNRLGPKYQVKVYLSNSSWVLDELSFERVESSLLSFHNKRFVGSKHFRPMDLHISGQN